MLILPPKSDFTRNDHVILIEGLERLSEVLLNKIVILIVFIQSLGFRPDLLVARDNMSGIKVIPLVLVGGIFLGVSNYK